MNYKGKQVERPFTRLSKLPKEQPPKDMNDLWEPPKSDTKWRKIKCPHCGRVIEIL